MIRNFVALTCLLAAIVSPLRCLADDPVVSRVSPPGFKVGTEVEMTLAGARLEDATEILFYDSGIELLKLVPINANSIKAQLRIDAECPPGLKAMRIATKTGISNIRYFGVSKLPQVAEAEPNSDFDKPQLVEMNSTINGLCKTEDVDYYKVKLAAGQKLTVELEGLRLGTDFFDPFVAILDAKRFELARSDDAPLLQQDCVCSFTAEQAGEYWIQVRESSFGGNDRCQYRLHIGDFPRPLAIIPSGGMPGEKINATVVDVSGETWKSEIQLPSTAGEFEYLAEKDGKFSPSPNKLRVFAGKNVLESEPDTDRSKLVTHNAPVAFNGILQEQGDVDWFKISAKKNQQLLIKVFGRNTLRSPLDSWLEIHKASGGRLAANDDSGGPDSAQTYRFPEDGEYLIAIRDQLSEGSMHHAYRIEVAPPMPAFEMAIDELIRYQSQTMSVPRGGQMAVLLRAKRSNFGGELKLRLEDAPAGLELVTPNIAANQSYIPFMLKASADADLDANLANLIAQTPEGGTQVSGTLNQRTMLVRGQNNRDVWGHNASRLSVAVTEKLPFDIELVQPEVPLVRNGSTNYHVKVRRDEGYKQRIYLRALYNPPGCRASYSIRIEGDKTEALIPITANSKAGIGTFPITILASATARNGRVWTATDFINFEVADSFFDFKFPKTVVEAGKSGVVTVGLEVKRAPEGEVSFEIAGLPAGVTTATPKLELKDGLQQLSYPITVDPKARAGTFKTVVVKALIKRPNGEILQTQGSGQVQIVPPAKAAPPASIAAQKKPAAPPAAKPLSRLEQLRQAKEKLQNAGGQ